MRYICCRLVAKSCLTLCNPMDCNLPASSVHRISQAWILECDAVSFSKRCSQPRDWAWVSCIGRWILHHQLPGSPGDTEWRYRIWARSVRNDFLEEVISKLSEWVQRTRTNINSSLKLQVFCKMFLNMFVFPPNKIYVLSHFNHVWLCNSVNCSPWTDRLLCPWGLSRQEYWSGLPCPPPGDLPNPGIEPESLMSSALAGRFFTTSAIWEVFPHFMGGENAAFKTRETTAALQLIKSRKIEA